MKPITLNDARKTQVEFIQNKLKDQNFYNGSIDGDFGPKTESAVKKFQQHFSLKTDGVVGKITASVIDLGIDIDKSLTLDPGNYFEENTSKKTLTIHHVAGWTVTRQGIANKNFFHGWNVDGKRIATHFSIDVFGKIYQHFPLTKWAHHLGTKASRNTQMNKESFSVELANEGAIEKDSKGRWRFWAGVLKRDVTPVQKTWRGHEYWANYTDLQYEALSKLILFLNIGHGLKINFVNSNLEYMENLLTDVNFEGIYSHSNVRTDKVDVSPAFDWNAFTKRVTKDKKKFIPFIEKMDSIPKAELPKKSKDMNVKEALKVISNMDDTNKMIEFIGNDGRETMKKKKQSLQN